MTTKMWSLISAATIAAALSFNSACAGEQEQAKPAAPAVEAPASPAPAGAQIDAKAMDILMKMANFLSSTQRMSATILQGYDVVQGSGQKVEFNEIRKVVISRPDHLRVEVEESDGKKKLLIFDGKNITLASSEENVYAQAASPGDIDGAIKYFVHDLHMRLPLAALVLNQLPAELERRVKSIDYVEETSFFGVPAHHLAARTDTVDFQVWVADGNRPLPLRVVLTYKNEAGQPQFWARFSDWNLSPKINKSTFAFKPPPAAHKISFLSQLSANVMPQPEAGEQKGGQP